MLGCNLIQPLERRFFRNLNRLLEPAIRAGIGSPWLVPVGVVVMETIGRKSGRRYNIPVVASGFHQVLVVSTVRNRSQWIRNLAAEPHIAVWLRGKRRVCTAYVVADGVEQSAALPKPSRSVERLIAGLTQLSKTELSSFAVLLLEPESEDAPAPAAVVQV